LMHVCVISLPKMA